MYANKGPVPAGCCEAIERDKPEIHRVIADLHRVVDRYDHLVGRMTDKLSCVTVCAPPACTSADVPEKGYSTGLANELNMIRCRLRDITDGLESTYERIEL